MQFILIIIIPYLHEPLDCESWFGNMQFILIIIIPYLHEPLDISNHEFIFVTLSTVHTITNS